MRMNISGGSPSVFNWVEFERCANKLEVCRRCKKHYQNHYIGVKPTGFYQMPDGNSYCDSTQQFLYEQMSNLELIEHMESIQQ